MHDGCADVPADVEYDRSLTARAGTAPPPSYDTTETGVADGFE